MMGAHHAACGAAAWVALTTRLHVDLADAAAKVPGLPHSLDLGLGLLDVGPMGVVTGALFVAGAAMAADADHHNATIAHSLPPLSNAICAGIGKLSGGHRHGTHSVVGIAAFTFVTWLIGLITPNGFAHLAGFLTGHGSDPAPQTWWGDLQVGAGILSVLMTAFAAKALKIIPDSMRKSPWAVGIAAGVFTTFFAPAQQVWLPLAMALGMVVHILGDMLTIEGCNLAWPFTIKPPKAIAKLPVLKDCWHSNGYMTLPLLGHAGSVREWILLVPISVYAVFGVGATVVAMGQTGLRTLVAFAGLH